MTDPIFTDCITCDGHGVLGRTPQGERVYCGDCSYGVGLELEHMKATMGLMGEWLKDTAGWDEVAVNAVREYLERLTVRFDELSALLDTLKQDETNRPRAHLFEDR